VIPIVGSALGALAGWLVTSLAGLAFANCDGPVAAGMNILTAKSLRQATAGGQPLHRSDDQPGVDSPAGCGSNSYYRVDWEVTALPTTPFYRPQ
jgi:hypothetical protein